MERLPAVSIIGTGALGSCLAKALVKKGLEVKSLYNRNPERAEALSAEVGADYYGNFPKHANEMGALVFVTVPDDLISSVSRKLSELERDISPYIFVHCSGNKPSSQLEYVKKAGARAASFHPLQTFTSRSTFRDFEGIYIDIEGDKKSVSLLGNVARKLGARWFEITPESKPFLHASAVVASNYLLALLQASARIGSLGGLDEKHLHRALLPLIRRSLKNAESGELSEVLTGPIARGDVDTVREHVELLEHHPTLSLIYRSLGEMTLELAEEKGELSDKQRDALTALIATDE